MLYFEPAPLFEARNYFVNHAFANSFDVQFNYIIRSKAMEQEATRYFGILSELHSRLKSSVTVDDDVISMLFTPIRRCTTEDGVTSFTYVCDMLARRIKDYTERSAEAFFKRMRAQKHWIPSSLIERLFDEPFRRENPAGSLEAMKRISGSNIADEEKFRAFQVIINPERYIDAYEAALIPVAKEFENCRELWAPLIALYRSDYTGMSEMEILTGLFQSLEGKPKHIDIYPAITTVQNSFISFVNGSSEEIVVFLGTLKKFDEENLVACGNDRERLFRVLSSLGNQSRYMIMCRLAESPAYGRELAAYLNLTPGTVSQHLSILAGFGLVNVSSDGTRLYYSVNKEQMERFIGMQRRIFLENTDKSGKK